MSIVDALRGIAITLKDSVWIALITNVITIGSLYLAFRQMRDGANQAKNLKTQVEQLQQIEQSLTTRRIGDFPDYLPEASRVLDNAKRGIVLMSLLPSHGIVSAYQSWVSLKHAIERAMARGVTMSVLVGNEEGWRAHNALQFRDALTWKDWYGVPENRDKIEGFLHNVFPEHKGKVNSFKEFDDLLIESDRNILKHVFSGRVERTDAFLPVFAWIADDSEAVFALNSGDGMPNGFYTKDPSIISALKRLKEHYTAGLALPKAKSA